MGPAAAGAGQAAGNITGRVALNDLTGVVKLPGRNRYAAKPVDQCTTFRDMLLKRIASPSSAIHSNNPMESVVVCVSSKFN